MPRHAPTSGQRYLNAHQSTVHASQSTSALHPYSTNLNKGTIHRSKSQEDITDSTNTTFDEQSSYVPSTAVPSSIDMDTDDANKDHIEENFENTYFMVKGSELLKLVPKCTCGSNMGIEANSNGACVTIRAKCFCGNHYNWDGSPKLTSHKSERKREINTIFPMAMYMGGLSYAVSEYLN